MALSLNLPWPWPVTFLLWASASQVLDEIGWERDDLYDFFVLYGSDKSVVPSWTQVSFILKEMNSKLTFLVVMTVTFPTWECYLIASCTSTHSSPCLLGALPLYSPWLPSLVPGEVLKQWFSNFNSSDKWPGHHSFKKIPGNYSVQSRLKTTGLEETCVSSQWFYLQKAAQVRLLWVFTINDESTWCGRLLSQKPTSVLLPSGRFLPIFLLIFSWIAVNLNSPLPSVKPVFCLQQKWGVSGIRSIA